MSQLPQGLGVPIKLLHECQGHIVCVETTTGDMFRGQLQGSEVILYMLSQYYIIYSILTQY